MKMVREQPSCYLRTSHRNPIPSWTTAGQLHAWLLVVSDISYRFESNELTILFRGLAEHFLVLPVLVRLCFLRGFHGGKVIVVVVHDTLLLGFRRFVVVIRNR